MDRVEKLLALRELRHRYADCRACKLCESRSQIVFADGDEDGRVMLIGEAPGEKEDETGVPFVGKSGKVIEEICKAIDVDIGELHITNQVMCRPPENRQPTKAEIAACRPRLLEQIRIVDPDLIIASGKSAAESLTGTKLSIVTERGSIVDSTFQGPEGPFTVPVMLTIHPAHLLRHPDTPAGGLLRQTVDDYRTAFAVTDRLGKLWYGKEPKRRTR